MYHVTFIVRSLQGGFISLLPRAPIDAGDLIEEPRSTDTEMSELARSISNDSPAGLLTVAFSSHGSH
jgi:hypothetical protein